MTDGREHARRDRLIRIAAIPLVAFASFNGLALAFGLFDSMDDRMFVERLVLAVMGGLAIALLIAFGWRMLMRGAAAGDRDPHTAALGGGLALVGIVVSAWFLASIIGGDDALKEHQAAYLDRMQGHANRIATNSMLDGKVLAATQTAAVEVDQMAKAEAANGLISQIDKGRGEWARSLEAFAVALAARAEDMGERHGHREELLTTFGKTVAAARQAASKGEHARFEDLITRGARLLAEADGIANFATVKSLGSGLMAREAREQIDKAKRRLIDVANDAETEWRKEDVPFYRPVSKQVAALQNGDAIPGAWCVAVAFEVLPLLLLLMVLVRPRDPEEPTRSGVNDNDDVVVEEKAMPVRQAG